MAAALLVIGRVRLKSGGEVPLLFADASEGNAALMAVAQSTAGLFERPTAGWAARSGN